MKEPAGVYGIGCFSQGRTKGVQALSPLTTLPQGSPQVGQIKTILAKEERLSSQGYGKGPVANKD